MVNGNILEVKNLHATINDIEILKGINLSIKPGEIHAIMGPNGSGKSTFSKVLAGHPSYKITSGEIFYKKENICDLEPDARSHKGIFLAFQYPVEIPGVNNEDFLRLAYNSKQKALNQSEVDPIEFLEVISDKLKVVNLDATFLYRNVNEGFSGGEKKRNEILQFAVLDSDLGILDETDSGLDIDALRTISEAINQLMTKNKSVILITHYKRLLEYIKPDYIHVMRNGKIIKTSDASFADLLEEKGYEWLE
jgi:Fe-S cluster assembly ATP-binding protein